MALGSALAAIALASGAYASTEQRKASRKASDLQTQYELQSRKRMAEQEPLAKEPTLELASEQGVNLGAMGLLIEQEKALSAKPKTSGLGTVASTLGLGTGA